MAFYVINVSIDAPDGYVTPNSKGEYKEDLSVNEVESIGELLLEGLFGIQNAVPEHDESDEEEDQISKIFFDWSLPTPVVAYQFTVNAELIFSSLLPYTGVIYGSTPAQINTPPPKIV